MIVALAGGVGGARLAVGLAALLGPRQLSIVVNTGDDFEHLGLSISPDLDTVMYTLAGVNNAVQGWGRADESWTFMDALGQLGGETWFRLGDRDLAVHVLRTQALARGVPLAEITRSLAQRLGVRHPLLPMSDTPVRTQVVTARGELAFQDYFVRQQCRPSVTGFRYAGSTRARAPEALVSLVASGRTRAVILCPSNPYISVAPIFSVPAIRRWLAQRDFPVVGVSPIVGGQAVKGPAAKMMRELGCDVSALGVARHYASQVDGWVVDSTDAQHVAAIERQGTPTIAVDTMMSDRAKSAGLAAHVLAFARRLGSRRPT
jgi:LPPG:FO 2-phospho-L-lactate transferase